MSDGSQEKDGQGPLCDDEERHGVEGVAEISPPSPSSDSEHVYPTDEHIIRDRPRMQRPESYASTASPPVVVVPRAERRGLFGRFAVVPEVVEPRDYPNKMKWLITAFVGVAAVAGPMASSVTLPALADITIELNTTPMIANLNIAVYMLSLSIFPLWWSSFSETLGRRTIYIVSFALFTVLSMICGLAHNIAMLTVFRFLSGGAAASVQTVGAGTIADVWDSKERGKAMGYYYIGPLCGPLFAPIVGGVLTESFGWRSTQWFLAALGAFILAGLFFCLPETLKARKALVDEVGEAGEAGEAADADTENKRLADVQRLPLQRVVTKQSVQVKTRKWAKVARRVLVDPLKIILYLRFPAVALTVWYASVAFGCLYFLNISVQKTFSAPPYNFPTMIVGLLYIPNSLGYLLAAVFGGRWIDHIMRREAKKAGRYGPKGKLIFRPEDRMRENAWIAAVMFPCALVWYGWCADFGVFWLAPMIANFLFGVGSMMVFSTALTMLTEFMPRQSSYGVAVNNFLRNIFSFGGALLAEPLISAIGNGWLFTILGAVGALSAAVIWAMKKYGPEWGERMDKELADVE